MLFQDNFIGWERNLQCNRFWFENVRYAFMVQTNISKSMLHSGADTGGGMQGMHPPLTRPKEALTWHLISLKIIAKNIFVLHITSLKMLNINLC